ncbi:molybdate ABC transporter substrate-binding protein [uncultured Enterovirga sp.]|uniref:molybdate ABC transporter substrate-binding protein n=1 Tax=uncultured Enterovirga sp. TaxID=2026352 RepID=UPI0035CBC5F3
MGPITWRPGWVLALALTLAQIGPFATAGSAQSAGPLVFAAASLKNALDDIAAAWTREGKPAPSISFAASNTLAKQIELGAPADIFFSADLDWMDYAQGKNLVRPDTRVDLLGNRIVLVAPKDSTVTLAVAPGMNLAAALGQGGRLAMGNVDAVPAGRYGKAALDKLGAWDGVRDRIAQGESVRAALLLVSRGEAPLGIVYATDAQAEPGVKIIGTFSEGSHPPIVYPVAVTKDATSPDAAAFVTYLRGPAAKAAFERQGFTVLNRPATGS